jgi:HEPN domain-containing protein
MRTDPASPSDWFLLADDRLEKADALHTTFGPSWSGVELLHEAVERYLKGYLISRGWHLVKTHDLNRLLAEACVYETAFAVYAPACQNLTEQFWEQHYPGGELDEVGEGYDEIRSSVENLFAVIRERVRS